MTKVKKSAGTRRKSGKVKFDKERASHAHESRSRKDQSALRMKIKLCKRQVDRLENELRNYIAKKEEKPKRKGPKGPEDWILKGAARPAALLARIAAGECDDRGNEICMDVGIDLLDAQKGNLEKHCETKKYVPAVHALGEAYMGMGNSRLAIKAFQKCLEWEPKDTSRARDGLVASLLDEGRAGEARILMASYQLDCSTVFAYSRLLMEYVAHFVLHEEDSSEELVKEALKGAVTSNPFIAVFICGYEIFATVVECLEDIKKTKSGSIEECYVYCQKNIGVWMDTDGLRDWLAIQMGDFEEPVINDTHCTDVMFLRMYETAVEMIKDQAADIIEQENIEAEAVQETDRENDKM